MRTRLPRLVLYGIVLPLAIGVTMATAVGPLGDDPASADLALPTSIAPEDAVPTELRDGEIGLSLSRSKIGFGPVAPGENSEPVALAVMNVGGVPVSLDLSATALKDAETGATIPADRIHVSTSPARIGPAVTSGEALPDAVLKPGRGITLHLTLATPAGDAQWVPGGSYGGSLTLHVVEVDA